MKLTISAAAAAAIAFTGTASALQPPLLGAKSYPQEMHDNLNPLKYTSTNGPYTERRSWGISREPPAGCTVDKVVLLMRHGSRYPSGYDLKTINDALAKVYNITDERFSGDLEFMNHWISPFESKCDASLETFSGPYGGRADAFLRGTEYRSRYGHLLANRSAGEVVPFFASDAARVVETARMFGQGFFGYEYANGSALNIIPEEDTQGANSLGPSCWANDTVDLDEVDDKLQNLPQFKIAAARLNSQVKGLNLTAPDVYGLMTGAGYELGIRPQSPWVTTFTPDEWATFGYAGDALYYYMSGPGNKAQLARGSNFVNATVRAIKADDPSRKLIMNFSHHSKILPMFAAFGIFTPDKPLPLTHPIYQNKWRVTDMQPMGGIMVVERMQCNKTVISPKGKYVRYVVNDAVVPMEECQSGPGFTCPLADWTAYYEKKNPKYAEECKVPKKYPQVLDFWWHANTTTDLNYGQTHGTTC